MTYRLRPARTSDEPAIWAATMATVWSDVPEDERPHLDRAAFEARFREYAREFVEGHRAERIVAEDPEDRLAGYVLLGELTPFFATKPVGFVYDLWVAPSHRRRGVARLLLDEGEHWAREKGYRKLKLEVAETNAPARALYAAVGFRPERVYMGKEVR